jgi:tetratricopeptide (TPR) repeat protein
MARADRQRAEIVKRVEPDESNADCARLSTRCIGGLDGLSAALLYSTLDRIYALRRIHAARDGRQNDRFFSFATEPMKAERRHELQHNEVADWVAASYERVKPYSRAIVAVGVAAAVLLIAYVVLSGRSERKRSVAWNDYYQAVQAESKDVANDLETVAQEHSGVPAGLWAEVALADLKLGEGIDSLFREKQAAQSKLRSAIQHYQHVLEVADDALLIARARYGLARAYESLGRLDEARDVYQQIVDSSGTNAYLSVAKERLKDLKRSSTQDFYAWFGKQEPVASPPASDLLPGTPGEKLPFDSSSLSSPGGAGLSGDNLLDIPPLDKGTT